MTITMATNINNAHNNNKKIIIVIITVIIMSREVNSEVTMRNRCGGLSQNRYYTII